MSKRKYIFVTGGVLSSLGKGVAAASIGSLLKSRGFSVHMRKFDPYLSTSTTGMNPMIHGETFLTNDGFETDLDLGYYERYLEIKLSQNDSISSGRIYWEVLNKERNGEYMGSDVQMIPHVSNHIKEYIGQETNTDFLICELGGTVGDIEQLIVIEAFRQFSNEVGRDNVMFIHLSYVPYIPSANEIKTKPTQASVRALLEKGIQADMLLCRTQREMSDNDRRKLAMFCNLKPSRIIMAPDVDNIYKVPLEYEKQDIVEQILQHFDMDSSKHGNLEPLQRISDYLAAYLPTIQIGIVEKYFGAPDAYKSLSEAVFHAGIANNIRIKTHHISAESLEKMDDQEIATTLGAMDGILVPGGLDAIGTKGTQIAAKFARENKIPYFGICSSMQSAVVEFMQNVCGEAQANSTAIIKNCIPVVCKTDNFKMGARQTKLTPGTLAHKIYSTDEISERHRNKFVVNNKFEKILNEHDMIISGRLSGTEIPSITELTNHPFFVGVQFHPEFQSSPFNAHPMFRAFVRAAMETSKLPGISE